MNRSEPVGPVRPRWWHAETRDDGRTVAVCGLCRHRCTIKPGGTGLCSTRGFTPDGAFVSPYLGKFSSVAIDPIEKKPLRRWRPGTAIYSLGSVGCNATCPFCQNHAIAHPDGNVPLKSIPPEDLLTRVRSAGVEAVAYTYNEPTLQAEYILAAAPLLRESGIATVMVTNGLFGEEPREALGTWVDAMNVDVKTFDENAYRRLGGDLAVVRSNVETLVSRGVHVEITNLIVPGVSDKRDDFAALVDWLAGLSREIPLHISRYFPAYKYSAPPTSTTLLRDFERYARDRLDYVYLGNV